MTEPVRPRQPVNARPQATTSAADQPANDTDTAANANRKRCIPPPRRQPRTAHRRSRHRPTTARRPLASGPQRPTRPGAPSVPSPASLRARRASSSGLGRERAEASAAVALHAQPGPVGHSVVKLPVGAGIAGKWAANERSCPARFHGAVEAVLFGLIGVVVAGGTHSRVCMLLGRERDEIVSLFDPRGASRRSELAGAAPLVDSGSSAGEAVSSRHNRALKSADWGSGGALPISVHSISSDAYSAIATTSAMPHLEARLPLVRARRDPAGREQRVGADSRIPLMGCGRQQCNDLWLCGVSVMPTRARPRCEAPSVVAFRAH